MKEKEFKHNPEKEYTFDPNNIDEYEAAVRYQDEHFDTLGLEGMLVFFEPSAYRKAVLEKATDEERELYYKLCDEM